MVRERRSGASWQSKTSRSLKAKAPFLFRLGNCRWWIIWIRFDPQMKDLGFGDPQSQKRTAGKAVDPEAAVQFKIVSRSWQEQSEYCRFATCWNNNLVQCFLLIDLVSTTILGVTCVTSYPTQCCVKILVGIIKPRYGSRKSKCNHEKLDWWINIDYNNLIIIGLM